MRKLLLVFFLLAGLTSQSQALTNSETKAVLSLVFGSNSTADLQINEQDKAMAAKFMNELVEKTCQLSIVEGVLDNVYSFNYELADLAVSIAKKVGSNCNAAAKKGKYSEAVRVTIARNWKSAFAIRKQTGEW